MVKEWMLNAAVVLAGLAAAWGGARAMISRLEKAVDRLVTNLDAVSGRLVYVEAAFKAAEALRLDERLRAVEIEMARAGSKDGTPSN